MIKNSSNRNNSIILILYAFVVTIAGAANAGSCEKDMLALLAALQGQDAEQLDATMEYFVAGIYLNALWIEKGVGACA